jgi:RNA polymerase sigma-70 factor, ECF subfamily
MLPGLFVPWLLTLARNKALDQLRLKSERQRSREEQTDEFDSSCVVPDFEATLDQDRHAKQVRSVMATLPSHQKRAIELAYFEGLTHCEIAAKL